MPKKAWPIRGLPHQVVTFADHQRAAIHGKIVTAAAAGQPQSPDNQRGGGTLQSNLERKLAEVSGRRLSAQAGKSEGAEIAQ
jgi:hypothetical protein